MGQGFYVKVPDGNLNQPWLAGKSLVWSSFSHQNVHFIGGFHGNYFHFEDVDSTKRYLLLCFHFKEMEFTKFYIFWVC
jgi:hypothetical protein